MLYPCQVITFLLGLSASFLNVFEAFSSAKIVSLNQSRKVLLCFFKTQFFNSFGLLSFTKPSCWSMYDKTSLLLFNTYKWTCNKSSTLGVIIYSPLEPLPPTLSSCRDSRSLTGLAFPMYSEQNSMASYVIYLWGIIGRR